MTDQIDAIEDITPRFRVYTESESAKAAHGLDMVHDYLYEQFGRAVSVEEHPGSLTVHTTQSMLSEVEAYLRTKKSVIIEYNI